MGIFEQAKNRLVRYLTEQDGPNRKQKKATLIKASRPFGSSVHGRARAKPKNWTRDKPKRRKEQKRRRKQVWRCK